VASAPGTPDDRPWFAHYAPGVPRHLEIPPKLLPEVVGDAVARRPEHPALRYYGATWTYRRFWRESENLAGALAAAGVGPGDRVALYLPNGPAYPIALFAALRLGAIAVPVSPLYLGDDLLRILKDAEPKALVTLEILYPNVARVRAAANVPSVFVARLREFYPALKRPFVNLLLRRRGLPTEMPSGPGVLAYRDAVRTPRSVPIRSGDPASTVAVLQYTGGTTGVPKAAMLTHRNLVANVVQSNSWNTKRTPGEVILASIPFFHIYGLTVGLLLALAEGWTVVIQTRPDVPELLGLIRRYRPTQFPGVPALYLALLQRPDLARYNLRSIAYCLSGSAPLPREVQERFEAATGGRVLEGYGLTEASPVTHVNPDTGERRVGSIGLPVPETDQRIVDPGDGAAVLGPGETGELAVRGPQVMLGYYHAPEETRRVLRDGWLLTGDLARIDADGYAYIVDRKKDMINVGGLKVYPREVEEVLFQHPAILEAAVVGVPDPSVGEAPKAFVVLRPGATATAEELIEFVRGRIAHYKAPRSVEFRASLPRSGVQKVLRRELREGSAPPG
jgi:long-chain acyl-CoA synthetase